MMNEERIEYFRTNPWTGERFEIISTKGNRKYNSSAFSKKEDRLFFAKITENETSLKIPCNYTDIYRYIELMFENIILDHVYEKEKDSFIELFKKIDERRKYRNQRRLDV